MAEPIAAPRPLAAKWVKVNRQHHAEVQAEQEARGWESHDQYDGATLPLVPGRRFRVYGKPGWFKFRRFIVSPHEGELVECYGPFTKSGADKVGCGTTGWRRWPDGLGRPSMRSGWARSSLAGRGRQHDYDARTD